MAEKGAEAVLEALWQELQPSTGQPRGPSSHSTSPDHLQLVPLGGVRPRQAHILGLGCGTRGRAGQGEMDLRGQSPS